MAAVKEQAATAIRPFGLWHEPTEIGLDLVWVVGARPFESSGNTANMGVDHDGGLAKSNPQNDVRRLPSHTRQCRQF